MPWTRTNAEIDMFVLKKLKQYILGFQTHVAVSVENFIKLLCKLFFMHSLFATHGPCFDKIMIFCMYDLILFRYR